jgi:dTDP-4-amino-4,6-dideoxygalactose transaminase
MIAHLAFEDELMLYTGAPYIVLTDSCTNAIELVCRHLKVKEASIPRYTWRGVPRAIRRAGAQVYIEDRDWVGAYQLRPTPIWDSARRFYAGMYKRGTFMCVSFHFKKILGHTRGGAILCDNRDDWHAMDKMTRDDGGLGMHCWMPSDVAAALHVRLINLPRHNADQLAPPDHYPDLMATNWNALT